MKRDNITLIIAVTMIAIVAIGGISIYFINPYSYDADVNINDDNAEYSLNVSNAIQYNILALDNFGNPQIEDLIICSDGSGYSERVQAQLKVRGFNNVKIVDPENLPEEMIGDPSGRGILILQGSFPEEIYSGNIDDILMKWLDNKGSVYWFGYLPKDEYKINESTTMPVYDYLLPFGLSEESFCTIPDGDVNRSHELCTQLCFRNSEVINGLKSDIGTPISYVSASGFSAITIMKVLNGTMVVLGGGQSSENSMDLAQVIASGISYHTELIGHKSGSVRNTTNDFIFYPSRNKDDVSVYIHVGGYYTTYGERF